LQLALGLLKHLLGEESWRLTPHPRGVRAITPAGGERVQLGFLLLPIAGEGRLTIVVPRLSGIDAVGQDIPHRRRLPNLILARRSRDMGRVQALGNVPATEVLFDQQPIDMPDDFRFPQVNHDLRGTAMAFGQIAVSIAPIGPREECAAPGFLSPAAPGPFENLGALVLGHHPLHLGEQFALWGIAKRVVF
jgi:hypothetical protein